MTNNISKFNDAKTHNPGISHECSAHYMQIRFSYLILPKKNKSLRKLCYGALTVKSRIEAALEYKPPSNTHVFEYTK